ncbi:MAG TPA: sigma-E factor regulatory protein RseB domain-containing protein [Pseudonocardiaceae bacterium]|nr:sigma-E factor regulatory protein RseB domain-containing protein [Pseudonocardiaceae bacterium]
MLGRKTVRWAVVAVAAAVACAVPSVVASLPVSGGPLDAAQLRQKIEASADRPYTGYASTQAELGLPELPAVGDVTKLLSGTTNIRAWYLAPDDNRVDVIDTVGERDVYQTPDGQFTWDYGSGLLTEILGAEPVRLPRAVDLLPPDLARRVLQMDPVDRPIALPARRIAGVATEGIRLRPTDPSTTVGQVDIWADPATGLPLRVEVTAKGAAKPLLISQFVTIDQHLPDPSALRPPDAGGQLATAQAPDIVSAIAGFTRARLPDELSGYELQPQLPGLPGVGRYGAGLATFVVLPLPRNIGGPAIDAATKAGATDVPVVRGRAVLIGIPLLGVLIEQVGRRTYLVAGFVNHAVLQEAANELAVRRLRSR